MSRAKDHRQIDKERSRTQPLRASIRYDVVNPVDFNRFALIYACEQCCHFDLDTQSCTFGYNVNPHLRDAQLASYNLSGKMAFCRFLEID